VGIVDACIHPVPRSDAELRTFMGEAWQHKVWPAPERTLYMNPRDDYVEDSWPDEGLPGSDPALVDAWLASNDVDQAVLLPLTRGLNPDIDLGSALCAATNDWLAATWLGEWNESGRYRGSIRVSPEDPKRAIEEIERWAEHPHMVQVAVPLEARNYYGKREYFDVWAAAARHGLPVAVHPDWSPGIDYDPAPVGSFRHFIEFATMNSANFFYHLCSLITEGVFDRLEGLQFVFTDGGADMVGPFGWRMDGYWRQTRYEHPWTEHLPTSYLRDHVRFCTNRMEGPGGGEHAAGYIELVDGANLHVYASNYPHWPTSAPADAVAPGAADDVRQRILAGNARELYGLEAGTTASAVS
jgi:predicted TIM-barrel fold metal-dependent hydrolase